MNYTVDQASKELNISKQAIYKQLKKEEFKEYIVIKEGIKHISEEGLKRLKGENPLEQLIKLKDEEITRLREDKKRLLDLLEQQNTIILNSQDLQKKALSNTELLLLEKREELKRRREEYTRQNNSLFNRFKLKFNNNF
ncbi:DNA-binding protein [Clostridium perfringens]|nr:DNA-binding protein [Clostridium perfringens]